MSDTPYELWSLWYPQAAATGLPFARGRLAPTALLLVHAAPTTLTVEVYDPQGQRIAYAEDLSQPDRTPIILLRRDGGIISREPCWPTAAELGLPVILPGGEVGILKAWWSPPDHSEWRWQVEFYNSTK